ncbi:MAG: phage portal protein, partial [Gammaproteobacteria bacterium]|nr:phage portal protein [Gammaproteobacteria bacterium]
WERCIASASIAPMQTELAPVSPQMLALAGRYMAVRGNAVFAIQVRGSRVQLIPAAYWDIRGTPEEWRYRLDLAGPSRTHTVNLPAASVLHFRIGADPRTPWRGRGPLERASKSGAIMGRIEAALEKETKVPVGRLWRIDPMSFTPDQQKPARTVFESGGIVTVNGKNADGSKAVDQEPYGPEPNEQMLALRTALGRDICSAYGISPALFSERGDGAGQREAWRRFWLSTIGPIGREIQTELKTKLHPMAAVTFEDLRASDADGMSRATMRRAQAYKIYKEEGKEDAEALRLAGVE